MEKVQLRKREKIEYRGEMLTVTEIAKAEGVFGSSLRSTYLKIGDIYEAVRLTKSRKTGTRERIEYHGEMHTLNSIAKIEGIRWQSLKVNYEKYGDIEKAIAVTKESKLNKNGSILYRGEMKTLNAIAISEGLSRESLKKYYDEFGNIEKAIAVAKRHQKKKTISKQRVIIDNSEVDLLSASIILGMKYNQLLNMLSKGITIDEIVQVRRKEQSPRNLRQNLLLEDGKTLRQYCLENKLNYTCIYYSVVTYGKSLEEAIDSYRKNGQRIPRNWIFDRYGVLLRHLMISEKIDTNAILRFMRNENLSLQQATQKYIIRKNAKKEKLDPDWIEELYSIFTDENLKEEYDNYRKHFFVDDKEESCVLKSQEDIERLERKSDLFEIRRALDENIFTPAEEAELLKQYNVQPEEIDFIFIDLYSRFNNGAIMGAEQSEQLRVNLLNEIIRKWPSLTNEERNDVINSNSITSQEVSRISSTSEQIEKYKKMIELDEKHTDANITAIMRASVGENVGNNEEVRHELHRQQEKLDDSVQR